MCPTTGVANLFSVMCRNFQIIVTNYKYQTCRGDLNAFHKYVVRHVNCNIWQKNYALMMRPYWTAPILYQMFNFTDKARFFPSVIRSKFSDQRPNSIMSTLYKFHPPIRDTRKAEATTHVYHEWSRCQTPALSENRRALVGHRSRPRRWFRSAIMAMAAICRSDRVIHMTVAAALSAQMPTRSM